MRVCPSCKKADLESVLGTVLEQFCIDNCEPFNCVGSFIRSESACRMTGSQVDLEQLGRQGFRGLQPPPGEGALEGSVLLSYLLVS